MDDNGTEHRLQGLFELFGSRYAQLLRDAVRDRVGLARGVYVFGAGQNGRLVANLLAAAGHRATAFIDDTPAKIGTLIDGIPVIDAAGLRDRGPALVIVSVYLAHHDYLSIADRLRRLGANTVSLLQFYWAYGVDHLPFYFHALPAALLGARDDVLWLARQLVDQTSRDELCAHVEFRLSLRHEILPAWSLQRLPPPDHWQDIGFVDAGAFDGDTLIPFVTSYGDRTAFAIGLEPDPANHAAMRKNIETLPQKLLALVEPLELAIDSGSGTAAFANLANAGSMLSREGDTSVRTISLDDLLADRPAEKIYVKMDVEGAEANVIRGAEKTIAERTPFLAVSAYHRPDDLWELPRQIRRLNPAYQFMLRSHGADGADLTLYAIGSTDIR